MNYRNKLSLLAIGMAASCASTSAFAQSADLTVTGSISPSPCTIALSGNIDYGTISAGDLNPDSVTKLDDRTIELTVNCNAARPVFLRAIDNRSASAASGLGGAGNLPVASHAFGLGKADEENIGAFRVNSRTWTESGDARNITFSLDAGLTWRDIDATAVWNNGSEFRIAPRLPAGAGPSDTESLSVEIIVEPTIRPTNELPKNSTIELDGSVSFELKYV